jgi:hypothetical protein
MESIPFGIFLTAFFCVAALISLPTAAILAQIIERRVKISNLAHENTTTFLIFFLLMVLSCIGLAMWNPKF